MSTRHRFARLFATTRWSRVPSSDSSVSRGGGDHKVGILATTTSLLVNLISEIGDEDSRPRKANINLSAILCAVSRCLATDAVFIPDSVAQDLAKEFLQQLMRMVAVCLR